MTSSRRPVVTRSKILILTVATLAVMVPPQAALAACGDTWFRRISQVMGSVFNTSIPAQVIHSRFLGGGAANT